MKQCMKLFCTNYFVTFLCKYGRSIMGTIPKIKKDAVSFRENTQQQQRMHF